MAVFAANRLGNGMIMMRSRLKLTWICTALALGVSACAQTAPGAGTQATGHQNTLTPGTGTYKVGAPYQIAGTWYYPKEDPDYRETGIASWYGPGFNGRLTANGEVYDQDELTAAHRTLPMPSIVRVTNLDNGRSIKVRINDRGPFARSRVIDVSKRGAQLLGFIRQGTAKVLVEIIDDENRRVTTAALNGEAAKTAPDAVPRVSVQAEALPGSVAPTLATNPTASQTALAVPVQSAVSTRASTLNRPLGSSEIFVQAGSFTNFNNANRLRARLSQLGEVRIARAMVEDTQFFRVRLGPVRDVDAADRLLTMLLANGLSNATVVVD